MKCLTLTYGVAPGPRRTLTIPIGRANMVLGLVAFATLWTLGSFAYLMVRWVTPATTEAHVAVVAASPAVAAVANATAAPVVTPPIVAAALVAAPAEAGPLVAASLAAAPEIVKVQPARAETAKAIGAPPTLVGPPAVAGGPPLPAAISGLHLARSGRHLVARFAVENRGTAPLAGVVEGHAAFRRADGGEQLITVSVPFRARIRSAKELRFPAPAADGTFIGLRLRVRGASGGTAEESFPVPEAL